MAQRYRRPTGMELHPTTVGKVLHTLDRLPVDEMVRGAGRILGRGMLTRPGFSGCWVMPGVPENGELLFQYPVGRSRVLLYRVPNEVDILYHLDLADYKVPPQYVQLIQWTREELMHFYPKQFRLTYLGQTRQYVQDLAERLMHRIAKERGISLGATTAAASARLKELSEILARHVAGLGVIELLLDDPHVQDVYVDAPASENRVHLRIAGYPDERVGDKALTNIIVTDEETEAILSRFRIESGRPFSEAMPVLETDLKEYNTRASVIGRPLSPDGIAIALRRHATDPWTLLKLLYFRSLTPFAAGLLSFLVDGRSTILVSGARSAGKTSLISALMLEFPKTQRILTIEDTLELPSLEMRQLGYKIQTIFVRSSLGGQAAEMSTDDALKVSLRLGESAIVLGEVRGLEARTLYEAMRAGTAGSAVLGTIHGNTAHSVYERVVHDLGISPTSFNATDIVIISGLTSPGGSVRMQRRRLLQVAELDKNAPDPGTFEDLLTYEEENDALAQTPRVGQGSLRIGTIAEAWGMTYPEALENIKTRAAYKEHIVKYAESSGRLDLLTAPWVGATNAAFWDIMEKHRDEVHDHTLSYDTVLQEWKDWFSRTVRYG
jgi:archaeal flagellar protein FlaI